VAQLLDVRHTLGELSARLGLASGERNQAAVRALNRTITTGRKDASADLRDEYPSLKVAQIKGRIKLQRATRAKASATLTFSGKRFSLYGGFGMREIRGKANNFGVRFAKLPWRLETVSGETVTPDMLARAFRNRGRGGRATVFSRHTRVRTSHEVLVAPGLARALAERGIRNGLMSAMRQRFGVVLQQEARFVLSKR
jgi:hypothetical protein